MSASREKKQRQGAGPSEKAVKVQQEQAAHKRQTIIYAVTGGVIAVLIAALLVWRSGFFQSRASAATVGDETLTAAELSYYYYGVRSTYANYGLIDTSKSDDEQFYSESEGKTYRDFFMESALANAQQNLALSRQAASDGHSESDIKDTLDAQIDQVKSYASSYGYSYSAYLKALYGDYMTPAIYEKLTTRYLMASLASTEKYDELYDSYSQSELEDYYKAEEHADVLDTIEYSSLYFPVASVDTKDADGNELAQDEVDKLKEEAKAEAKQKAEDALKAVEGGSTFQSQIDKYELTGTNNVDHTKKVGVSTLNTSFSEHLLHLDADECELVETDNGYFVVSLHGRYLDEEPTRDVRHILVRAETTTDEDGHVTAPTDEAWAAAKAEMDEIQAAWDASGKTEDEFAALANEKSDDGDGTTGGLYTNAANGAFVTEFNDWVFDASRKAGDVGMVQHEGDASSSSAYWGYHLIYYVGENEPVWMVTVRDTLAKDARTEWIEQLTESIPTAELGGAASLGK